jgi:hypothetical protein
MGTMVDGSFVDVVVACSSADGCAPLDDGRRCAADTPPAASVASPTIAGADVAAHRVDGQQFGRLAQPVGADASRVVDAATRDSTPVAPPAAAQHSLAHSCIVYTTNLIVDPIKVAPARLYHKDQYSNIFSSCCASLIIIRNLNFVGNVSITFAIDSEQRPATFQ